MASITKNGVVLEVPYAIIRNVRNQRPWSLSVVDRNNQLRALPATVAQESSGVFVYAGDTVTFTIQAPVNDAAAAAYDLYSVNFTTGVETNASTVRFNQVWQRSVKVVISAIDASSGALSLTTTRS